MASVQTLKTFIVPVKYGLYLELKDWNHIQLSTRSFQSCNKSVACTLPASSIFVLHLCSPAPSGTHSPVKNTIRTYQSFLRSPSLSVGFFSTIILIYDDGVGTNSMFLHQFFEVIQCSRGHLHRSTWRKNIQLSLAMNYIRITDMLSFKMTWI